VQNRLDPVLETGHLRDKLRSFSHDATTRLSLFVRHPHFGQKSARMELRQHRRVDLIGLDLCPGDGRTRIGLAMTTRPTKGKSTRTIALVLPVASMTISSSA